MLSGKPGNSRMKQIPPKISALYDGHLNNKAIPKKELFNYGKWLRYYLDFCLKYNHNQLDKNNIKLFIEKLEEKKQTEEQQKQAFHAVSLYYELDLINFEKGGILNDKNENLSIKKESFRHTNANHLLQANFDIRTIRELLGHSDARTTMIYTHTIKSQTIKEAKSPLDF